FLHDPPPTHTPTLSLHDALPIWGRPGHAAPGGLPGRTPPAGRARRGIGHYGRMTDIRRRASRVAFENQWLRLRVDEIEYADGTRSEEHTSELQSPYELVCRLLLE